MKPFNFTKYILNNPLLEESSDGAPKKSEEEIKRELEGVEVGQTVKITLDNGKVVKYERVGSSKSGEPTFKIVGADKEKRTVSTLSASHIKDVNKPEEKNGKG